MTPKARAAKAIMRSILEPEELPITDPQLLESYSEMAAVAIFSLAHPSGAMIEAGAIALFEADGQYKFAWPAVWESRKHKHINEACVVRKAMHAAMMAEKDTGE